MRTQERQQGPMVMSEIVDGKFSCAACGKRFTWKPELAGRKGKCTCGAQIEIPHAPAPPQPALQDPPDDLYDLKEPVQAPAAKAKPRPAPITAAGAPSASVTAAAGAVAAPAAPVIPYRRASKEDQAEREVESKSMMIDYWLPIGLILVGVILQFVVSMRFADEPAEGIRDAVIQVGTTLVVKVVLLAVGCLIAVKVIDIAFGAPGPAILKLCAIALAPGSIGAMVTFMLGGGFVAVMVGAGASIVIYWLLFKVLFDLDFGEIMSLVVIIWLINQWAVFFIVGFFLSRG